MSNKRMPWMNPNEHGEKPGDICCQRSAGGFCFDHDPNTYIEFHGMTPEETICMGHLVDAYKIFAVLPIQDVDNERRRFVDGLHNLQCLLAMRVVQREYVHSWGISYRTR